MGTSSRTEDKDLGLILVLLERLNTFRLPRALELEKRVDAGESLSASDILFLQQALSEGGEVCRLASRHPEYQGVVDKMTALYAEIVRKGTENESAGANKKHPDARSSTR